MGQAVRTWVVPAKAVLEAVIARLKALENKLGRKADVAAGDHIVGGLGRHAVVAGSI